MGETNGVDTSHLTRFLRLLLSIPLSLLVHIPNRPVIVPLVPQSSIMQRSRLWTRDLVSSSLWDCTSMREREE